MKSFIKHTGLVVPMDRNDVDTDQIIPKQFLKRIERTGFGIFAFYDWRYQDATLTPNPDFELNKPEYQGATILLTRKNFGCGSSREHAPWALDDFGFRVILASGFADIFYNNCFKNGLLPICLSEEVIDELFRREAANRPFNLTVDLERGVISDEKENWTIPFEIDASRKYRLIQGLDDIGLTLQNEIKITEYEKSHGMI
ncbi:MAG: 3-isopropylmalate dehydratase small subunit [Planctomycetaceae bacterium]|jgi:3-isopropylmalate/(R)-2-methylmalate dehydratase small subunit|nr:3-isopropylmalate dehydratase small subunit [Planctomycetaceae bacterium]